MFRRLDGHLLIALDGSEYHGSRKIHCRHCSTRLRGKGEMEYYDSMLAATLVAPGHEKVVPLEPEFIVPQDGAEQQDCENTAAKRWLAAHGQRYAALDPVYLGFPEALSALEIQRFFTPTPEEKQVVLQRRSTTNRIAFALQIGFLKMTGRLLNSVELVPPDVLSHLGGSTVCGD